MGALFNYHKKFKPDYNPYGAYFTERQERIIFGEPVNRLRKKELTTIMRKAEKLGVPTIAESVYVTYKYIFVGKKDKTKYTLEESQAILQKLTPFIDPIAQSVYLEALNSKRISSIWSFKHIQQVYFLSLPIYIRRTAGVFPLVICYHR